MRDTADTQAADQDHGLGVYQLADKIKIQLVAAQAMAHAFGSGPPGRLDRHCQCEMCVSAGKCLLQHADCQGSEYCKTKSTPNAAFHSAKAHPCPPRFANNASKRALGVAGDFA